MLIPSYRNKRKKITLSALPRTAWASLLPRLLWALPCDKAFCRDSFSYQTISGGGVMWLLSQAKAVPPNPWLSCLWVPLSSRSAGCRFLYGLCLGGKLVCNWAPMPATPEEASHIYTWYTWCLTLVVRELGPWRRLQYPILQNSHEILNSSLGFYCSMV